MALGTTPDVQIRMGRPLTSEEAALSDQLLVDVELLLTSRLPAALVRAATDSAYAATVVVIEAMAVARVLRNPEGYRFEQSGPFSYSLDSRAAAGFLTILDEEWRQLGYSTAFSIDTVPAVLPSMIPRNVFDSLYGWR